jgi:hypothetical protein
MRNVNRLNFLNLNNLSFFAAHGSTMNILTGGYGSAGKVFTQCTIEEGFEDNSSNHTPNSSAKGANF